MIELKESTEDMHNKHYHHLDNLSVLTVKGLFLAIETDSQYYKDKDLKQAIKRAKQNAETYKLRHAQRSMVRTAVKAVRASIEANDVVKAKELLSSAEKVLDSSASKKVIHKNAAARTKSRLSKAVKALG